MEEAIVSNRPDSDALVESLKSPTPILSSLDKLPKEQPEVSVEDRPEEEDNIIRSPIKGIFDKKGMEVALNLQPMEILNETPMQQEEPSE